MVNQAANAVLVVEPKVSYSNPETKNDNVYQVSISEPNILQKVHSEFDDFCNQLSKAQINFFQIADVSNSPDAIFPNNIFIFSKNNKGVICPVFSNLRRKEKENLPQIISQLPKNLSYNFNDFSYLEQTNEYCEGTGSLVFDHQLKLAFAAISNRTSQASTNKIVEYLGYKPIFFNTSYNHKPIYHTNVVMTVTSKLVIVCLEAITQNHLKKSFISYLNQGSKQIIDITINQKNNFAANGLEVVNKLNQSCFILSQTALKALNKNQISLLEKYHKLVVVQIPTIEKIGGGSARCMIAELF